MNEISSFETALGSVYTYDPSGRVLRQKSALGSTMEASTSSFDRTVFVSPQDRGAVEAGYQRGLKPLEDGTLQGLDYNRDKLDNVKFSELRKKGVSFDEAYTSSGGTITPRNITPELQPKMGYNPFEYNLGNNKYHVGSEVTKINKAAAPIASSVTPSAAKSKGLDMYELGKKLHPEFEKDMPASLKAAFEEGRIKTIFRTSSTAVAGEGAGRLSGGAITGGESLSLYAVDEEGRIARLGKGGAGWTGDPRVTGVGMEEGTALAKADITTFAEDVRYRNPYIGGDSSNAAMIANRDSLSKIPQVGFNPVEFDGKGGVHTGSFITDIYHSTGEAEISDRLTTGRRRRCFKNT